MTRRVLEVEENSVIAGVDGLDFDYLRLNFGKHLSPRRDGWVFVRVVGHIVLPSGRVLRIRSPKAPKHALTAWLAYTDPSLKALHFDRDTDDLAAEGELSGLLAAVYVRQLIRACTTAGVTRLYQPVPTLSTYVRGKIDLSRLIRRGGDLSRIPCVYWTHGVSTPLNCFLVAALERARRDPLASERLKGSFSTATELLAGVPARVDQGLLSGHRTLARNEWPFRGVYRLARTILQHSSLADGHSAPGFAFILDLERLFEDAVVTAFQRAEIDCTPKWEANYLARDPNDTRSPMVMDLLCRTAEGLLVVDAKFKHEINTSNLQQMVTYCFLSGASRAWLVLPGEPRKPIEYRFLAPDGRTIVVEIRYLATSAATLRSWEENGAALVRELVPPSATPNAPQSKPILHRPKSSL